MRPIDARKGRDLNVLTDDYLEKGVRDENDLEWQLSELSYISEMGHKKEVRLSPSEHMAIYGMIKYIREKLECAKINKSSEA